MTDTEAAAEGQQRRRGRHRRPRPRKILFAAGGLALAAGVLSLVRLSPDSGLGGGTGTTEAEPRLAPGDAFASARPDNAAATIATTMPTATSVMGGASTTPTPGPRVSLVPTTPPATVVPGATTIPGTTNSPTPPPPTTTPATAIATPQPTQTPTPTPTPTPSQTSHSPAPQPHQSGICVPIIGLCVDPLTAPRK